MSSVTDHDHKFTGGYVGNGKGFSLQLIINGEKCDFSDGLSLAALVDQLAMKAERVAVELNRDIVPRDRWPATSLQDGDRLEIVHFVGGG